MTITRNFTMLAVLLLASIMLTPTFSYATPGKNAVYDKHKNFVVDKHGNCVRTKWTDNVDPCAPVPKPVVRQPQIHVSQEERTIYFDFNSADISPMEQQKILALANIINHASTIKHVKVVGYTDQFGKNDYNIKLSNKRVHSVIEAMRPLIRQPISQDKMAVMGLGKAPNSQCTGVKGRTKRIECMRSERRVEVVLQQEIIQ